MVVADLSVEEMKVKEVNHYPVMYREAVDLLDIKNKRVVVDCTVGTGAHALKFFEVMPSDARLIGIDTDGESLDRVYQRLKPFEGRFFLSNGNFSQIDSIFRNIQPALNFSLTDAVEVFFFDLGISSCQLSCEERGFSFLKEGPLDMRMDRKSSLCAYDLVNNLSEEELSNIFRDFGEERYAGRIARYVVTARRIQPISTTTQLAQIILRAAPLKARKFKIHPATRVFQALRIAVNRELEILEGALVKAVSLVKPGGRIGVISFHSLEDRIVKNVFRDFSARGIVRVLTKKPLIAASEELSENSRSRSAKFRVVEKI